MKMLVALGEDPHAEPIRAALATLGWDTAEGFGEGAAAIVRRIGEEAADAALVPAVPGAAPLVASLRRADPEAAVLALGRAPDLATKRRLFEAGADDVLAHPVAPEEITLRAEAVLRRRHGHAASAILFGRLAVVPGRGATLDGVSWRLTRAEWRIVEMLALRAGRPVAREALMARLYADRPEPPNDKVLDVVICRLRHLLRHDDLDPSLIATVWGQGYAMPRPFGPSEPMPDLPIGTCRFVPALRAAPSALTAALAIGAAACA